MTDAEKILNLEKKIQMYHKTLVQERQIKTILVDKLETIKKLVQPYSRRKKTKGAKRAGIPFLAKEAPKKRDAPFLAQDNDQDNAKLILLQIRQLLN